MSFGIPEVDLGNTIAEIQSAEAALDPTFTKANVVYIASTGDAPGTQYPAVSPNVIAAGGTSISRNTTTGKLISENTWQDAGGGLSLGEARPAFQSGVSTVVGTARGTPDLAFDANPTSGVWVFNTNPTFGTGFFIVGGTSLSAPALAGIINAAGGFKASSQAELQEIYTNRAVTTDFHDITIGNCGLNVGSSAIKGYDLCTGVGTDVGRVGK